MQLLDVNEGTGQLKVGVKILLVTPHPKKWGQLTPLTPRIAAYEYRDVKQRSDTVRYVPHGIVR
jgi:hypothetical protein